MTNTTVRKYEASDEKQWNEFVRSSKNATFLFHRAYMDYHATRFTDHSLLIFSGRDLRSVFVANEAGSLIISHGGLSYGGMLVQADARLEEVMAYFYHVMKYFDDHGFTEVTYKCIPPYLMTAAAFEDQYALFLMDAVVYRRDMSCVYSSGQPMPFQQRRLRSIRKGVDSGYRVVRTSEPAGFWSILEVNLLERFGVRPVHSVAEIKLLMDRFPDEIHCFEVHDQELLGGVLIFETATAAHAQYISASPMGKKLGGLDVLFHKLITETFGHKAFFSLGISNENDGRELNRGLLNWKEGFGSRVFPIDFYKVSPANYSKLELYA